MSVTRKNSAIKSLKKRGKDPLIVVESRIAAKDTLFPEKVAKANRILKNTKFDPSLNL